MADERLNLVDKVLAYVSSPFRLFAMVLMAVLTFSGYFVYTNQELLIGAYKESKKIPTIAEDRVEDAAAHLFKQSGALIVAVFKVNSMFGTRVLYRAYGKNGRDKTNDGLDVGLFTQNVAATSSHRRNMSGRESVTNQIVRKNLLSLTTALPSRCVAHISPYLTFS